MTNLILPVAGLSSRFPNVRPKYLLTHPLGDLMLFRGIRGLNLDKVDNIFVTMLKEHADKYDAYHGVMRASSKLNIANRVKITILDKNTRDQPETVAETIIRNKISGPIFIKDADNYYETDITNKNSVSVFNIESLESVNAGNKSYVNVNNGLVTNIIEKKVISPLFCCGGYSFSDAKQFLEYYKKSRKEVQHNLYISHIIYRMLLDDISFLAIEAFDYIDWGTLKDWERYRENYGTIFVDLDGVIVKNSGEYFLPIWGSTDPISTNVIKLNKLYDSKRFHIIITTSRSELYKQETEEQLQLHGVKYHKILFGLPHARRYLINDYASTNPYPSAVAVNIKRNGEICGIPDISKIPEMRKQVINVKAQKPLIKRQNKKVAICISGLARTFSRTIENFNNNILSNKNCEFDVFISTWDQIDSENTTHIKYRKEVVNNNLTMQEGDISNSSFEIYSPKSLEMEKEFDWPRDKISKYLRKRTDTYIPSVLFMLYKIWCADLMRRKFEKVNNFEYDLVIRTRFDISISKKLSLELNGSDILIPNMHMPKCNEFNVPWVNDTFAVGKSDAMKVYSDLFLNIDRLYNNGSPFQPEIMLNDWLELNNINIDIPNVKTQIIRPNV